MRGPNVTPGYWRAARADRATRSTRRAITDSATRCASPIPRTRAGPDLRRPRRRGLQAGDRHLGQCRAAARGVHRRISRRCVQDVVIAGLDRDEIGALVFRRSRGVPRFSARGRARRTGVVLGAARRRAAFGRAPASLAAHSTGSSNRVTARSAARRAAIDRPRRDDRQGLDQPARGAEPSRGAGRRALRRSRTAATSFAPVIRRLRIPPNPVAVASCTAIGNAVVAIRAKLQNDIGANKDRIPGSAPRA